MSYYEGGRITMIPDGTIPQDALVKVTSAGKAAVCSAGDDAIGVCELGTTHGDGQVGVRLLNAGGTAELITSATIAPGAKVTTAASGGVAAYVSSGPVIGTCLKGVTSGGIVEVILG